jgi:magnesium-transporting ATPase (P-type)
MPIQQQQEGNLEPRRREIRTSGETGECENTIRTTKYTLFSWLPVSLLEQFRRLANAYFLIISILMLIGTYAPYLFSSPLNPYSTVSTLLFVLMVTCIKEGYEDILRHRCDVEDNNRPVTILTFDKVTDEPVETIKKSQDIRAGDIIKLIGRMAVPADVVLLLTSNFSDSNQCYVETTNIDGETNLKVREAPAALKQLIDLKNPTKKSLFSGSIEYELPSKNIHTFIGALHFEALSDPVPLVIKYISPQINVPHFYPLLTLAFSFTGSE